VLKNRESEAGQARRAHDSTSGVGHNGMDQYHQGYHQPVDVVQEVVAGGFGRGSFTFKKCCCMV